MDTPQAETKPPRTARPVVGDGRLGLVLYAMFVNGIEDHPAVVTRVFEPRDDSIGYAVNLMVLCDGGSVVARQLVPYDAGEPGRPPKVGTWRWAR